MAYEHNFEGLELNGVTELNRDELGRGAYGRVYAVSYCQTMCAAKEIHSILVEGVGQLEMQRTIESFIRECRQCSTLRHPNVIQFLGVYYPPETGSATNNIMRLPVMVMEMMADSLTSFVDKHEKIPVHIKYSIVHDVSLGLCYLHNHDPPIVHRDLSPNNVLLTVHHVAKISDLGVAKVIRADSRNTMTKAPGTVDFMPLEALSVSPVYGPPMDVFSFAGIILHTFNQQWPRPLDQVQFDPKTRRRVALSEVERRQQYLDKMIGEAEVLRPLVEECLDDDPAVRPTTATVCERIQVSKDAYMKESPQEYIMLYQDNQLLKTENLQQKLRIEQLTSEIELIKSTQNATVKQMYSARSVETSRLDRVSLVEGSAGKVSIKNVATQVDNIVTLKERPVAIKSKLKTEAPPLMAAFTSDRHRINWTRLADLPSPLYAAHAVIKEQKVYVAGGDSLFENTKNQIFVYDLTSDQWDELPPSGHYYGIPHIIGGKLAIVGGRLSATMRMTNKVSTFDEDSQTWTSYYPDLLSVRSRPGVVSHLGYTIVAGGGKPTGKGDNTPVHDDIEVLNWIENSHWRKISIKLPVPMVDFKPTISEDHLLTGCYSPIKTCQKLYKIPVATVIAAMYQNCVDDKSTKWIELTMPAHLLTNLIPGSSPPVVLGGEDATCATTTADIEMYDNFYRSWKKIGSLPYAKSRVAVTAISNNAIIVIGGCTKPDTLADRRSSSLAVVELGQVELLY